MKELGVKDTPLSQINTFHILCCKAIVYPESGDTNLDRQACQHDQKVIVIPFLLYMQDLHCKGVN